MKNDAKAAPAKPCANETELATAESNTDFYFKLLLMAKLVECGALGVEDAIEVASETAAHARQNEPDRWVAPGHRARGYEMIARALPLNQ